jgi:hypothetical protein
LKLNEKIFAEAVIQFTFQTKSKESTSWGLISETVSTRIVRMPAESKTEQCRKVAPLGGKARAKALSPERRREIASAAAKVRWAKRSQKAEGVAA